MGKIPEKNWQKMEEVSSKGITVRLEAYKPRTRQPTATNPDKRFRVVVEVKGRRVFERTRRDYGSAMRLFEGKVEELIP